MQQQQKDHAAHGNTRTSAGTITIKRADLADDGALDEAAEDDQQRRQDREQLQVAGRVLPPVEVAASPHSVLFFEMTGCRGGSQADNN